MKLFRIQLVTIIEIILKIINNLTENYKFVNNVFIYFCHTMYKIIFKWNPLFVLLFFKFKKIQYHRIQKIYPTS